MSKIKDIVSKGNIVIFQKYFDGDLWYRAIYNNGYSYFDFPVPVSDIGNATFLAQDKAMLFMRYIRKHLESEGVR